MSNLDVSIILRLVDQVSGRARQVSQSLKGVEDRLQSASRSMRAVGTRLSAVVTAPVVGLGVASFKSAAEFDRSMGKIVGLVGVSRDEVAGWTGDLEKLAMETGRPLAELGEGLFQITSAGMRGAEAIDTLRNAAMASASGLGTVESVADAVTSAVNAYGAENLDAARATDVLVAAVREGKLSASALAPVLGDILPLASEMGVSFDQVGASIAAMSRLGADPSSAATSLQAMLATLAKPTTKARETLQEYGLSVEELREQLADPDGGLLSVLFSLRESFGNNDEALSKVFPNIRALRGALNLAGRNAAETEKIFRAVAKSLGLNVEAFRETDSAARSMERLSASWQVFRRRIGAAIEPHVSPRLNALAERIDAISQRFSELNQSTQNWILGAGAAAAALGPVTLALAGLAWSLSKVVRGAALVGAGFAALGTSAGLLKFMRVIRMGTGIGLFAALLGTLAKRSDELAPSWQRLNDATENLNASLARLFGFEGKSLDLSNLITGLSDTAVQTAAAMIDGMASALERLQQAWQGFRSGDRETLGEAFKFDGVPGIGEQEARGAQNIWNALKGWWSGDAAELPPVTVQQPAVNLLQRLRDMNDRIELPQGGAFNEMLKRNEDTLRDLRSTVDRITGSDMPALAGAQAPVQGDKLPPQITIDAKGPNVNVKQAPPQVGPFNISVTVQSPDQAPEATARAVGEAISREVRAGLYDGVSE